MEKKTAVEIIEFILNYFQDDEDRGEKYASYYDFAHNGCKYERDGKNHLVKELGEFELVHEEGGYEGGGEQVERVYHFIDHNVYLQVNGYYCSNEGTNYDEDPFEVEPKEVVVIQYNPIEKSK